MSGNPCCLYGYGDGMTVTSTLAGTTLLVRRGALTLPGAVATPEAITTGAVKRALLSYTDFPKAVSMLMYPPLQRISFLYGPSEYTSS